eukprot:TRINITY_DN3261_c0_g2_i1.p1 TRINITY_DN3261_c0_g2~~TRINITY_DN3261_c0_g2_i1.p1  ORF type:complete len:346 (-),score=63.60 TRINITY_DN3261_c0_g2_i1:658-1695(-)
MERFESIETIPMYLRKWLKANNFLVPSHIQKLSLEVNSVRSNIIAQSKNGTGKTLAFLLVLLSNLTPKEKPENDESCLECIILAPTRELVQQIYTIITDITAYASPALRVLKTIGGQLVKGDIDNLKAMRPQVLVGSLGRVVHLIKEEVICLGAVKTLVVDEADQLFVDKSFKFDMRGLVSLLPRECQKLVYSATYPTSLLEDLKEMLGESVFIRSVEEKSEEAKSEEPQDIDEIQLKGIHQYYISIDEAPFFEKKLKLLVDLLSAIKYKQCMIFFNQKLRGAEIASHLKSKKIQTVIIHGDQNMNERTQTISKMRKFGINAILSTDLVNIPITNSYHAASIYRE